MGNAHSVTEIDEDGTTTPFSYRVWENHNGDIIVGECDEDDLDGGRFWVMSAATAVSIARDLRDAGIKSARRVLSAAGE